MCRGDFTRDKQPQAQAAGRCASLTLVIHFELNHRVKNCLERLRRNEGSPIAHTHHDLVCIALCTHRDRKGVCTVLRRIVEQV